MKRIVLPIILLANIFSLPTSARKSFTLEQILSAPSPSDLTAAKKDNRVAWTVDQQGKHHICVAEWPGFAARQITKYNEDDGQELSGLCFSADTSTIVYVRGGDKNAAGQVPNPTSNAAGAEVFF